LLLKDNTIVRTFKKKLNIVLCTLEGNMCNVEHEALKLFQQVKYKTVILKLH